MVLQIQNKLEAHRMEGKIPADIVQISTFTLKLEQDIIRNRFLFNFYICEGEMGRVQHLCHNLFYF